MPLREIDYQDLELVLSWRNHPKVRLNMFSQSIIDLERHREWFRCESEKETSMWLLYINDFGKPSGVVGFTNLDSRSSNAFWGFYTEPESEPGTGFKMGMQALSFFFDKLGYHKLNADVLEANKRSHRYHERLGFKKEGFFRDQYLGADGFQGVSRFGLLEADWSMQNHLEESDRS